MSVDDITFVVYYGGNWVTTEVGELAYIGGESKKIECKEEEFFTILTKELGEELYGKALWYKLPYENNKERKTLAKVDVSFKRMCEVARWVKFVEIFVDESEDPNAANIIGAEPAEPCEEDVRVERNVASFVDEDEDFDYHNTPPNSDGEEEHENYVRCKKGSGELKMHQVFDSLDEFKDALVDYSLQSGWNIMLSRWGKDKSTAVCGVQDDKCPCFWRIYCSYEEHIGKWMVKTFENEHSCVRDGYSKILKSKVIAKLFLDDVRSDPELKPKTIQEQIEKNFDLMTTIDQCRDGKEKALEIIQREHEEQFARLRDYRTELLRSNPGSTVVLDTILDDSGEEIFHRFYVCFANLRKTWSMWCRPIFGLDGCFLKCTLRGQLLAAVGRDANNGMYPFAWAVVDVENEDNWLWFIQKLKADFDLDDGHGYTVISDRQKGLLNAVDRELPKVEHRMCARHIYANLKKIFPNQSDMKGLFWRVAESYTSSEYDANLKAVKAYDMRLFEAVMQKNPQNCSLAFFTPTASCIDVHNNISESFNNAIDPARYMPMVEMLETIRRRAMVRIDLRKQKAKDHKSRFTKRAVDFIELEQKKIKFCRFVPGQDGKHEVRDCGSSVSVNMRMRTCACRKWDMNGLPCRHALRVIAEKKLNYEDYTSNWYSNARQQHIYANTIEPVNGMRFWKKSESVIKPAPHLVEEIQNRKGRKVKPKRKKGKHESPIKKASRKRRIIHCGRCGQAGHNATKCQNIGVEIYRRKKTSSKTVEDGYESMTVDYGEGPSQPTQN